MMISNSQIVIVTASVFAAFGIFLSTASLIFKLLKKNPLPHFWKYAIILLDVSAISLGLSMVLHLFCVNDYQRQVCAASGCLLLLGYMDTLCSLFIVHIILLFIQNPRKTTKVMLHHKRRFIVGLTLVKSTCVMLSILPILAGDCVSSTATTLRMFSLQKPGEKGGTYSILLILCFWLISITSLAFGIIGTIKLATCTNLVHSSSTEDVWHLVTITRGRLLHKFTLVEQGLFLIASTAANIAMCAEPQEATGKINSTLVIFSICSFIHGLISKAENIIWATDWCRGKKVTSTENCRILKSLKLLHKEHSGKFRFEATWIRGKNSEARGVMKVYSSEWLESWDHEIMVLGMLRKIPHPNLLQCLWTSNNNPYYEMVTLISGEVISSESRIICLELANFGCLKQYLEKGDKPLSATMQHRIICDVAQGLLQLHSLSILHNRLNSLTVYIKGAQQNLQATIGDFEYASSFGSPLQGADNPLCKSREQFLLADIRSLALLALEVIVTACSLSFKFSRPYPNKNIHAEEKSFDAVQKVIEMDKNVALKQLSAENHFDLSTGKYITKGNKVCNFEAPGINKTHKSSKSEKLNVSVLPELGRKKVVRNEVLAWKTFPFGNVEDSTSSDESVLGRTFLRQSVLPGIRVKSHVPSQHVVTELKHPKTDAGFGDYWTDHICRSDAESMLDENRLAREILKPDIVFTKNAIKTTTLAKPAGSECQKGVAHQEAVTGSHGVSQCKKESVGRFPSSKSKSGHSHRILAAAQQRNKTKPPQKSLPSRLPPLLHVSRKLQKSVNKQHRSEVIIDPKYSQQVDYHPVHHGLPGKNLLWKDNFSTIPKQHKFGSFQVVSSEASGSTITSLSERNGYLSSSNYNSDISSTSSSMETEFCPTLPRKYTLTKPTRVADSGFETESSPCSSYCKHPSYQQETTLHTHFGDQMSTEFISVESTTPNDICRNTSSKQFKVNTVKGHNKWKVLPSLTLPTQCVPEVILPLYNAYSNFDYGDSLHSCREAPEILSCTTTTLKEDEEKLYLDCVFTNSRLSNKRYVKLKQKGVPLKVSVVSSSPECLRENSVQDIIDACSCQPKSHATSMPGGMDIFANYKNTLTTVNDEKVLRFLDIDNKYLGSVAAHDSFNESMQLSTELRSPGLNEPDNILVPSSAASCLEPNFSQSNIFEDSELIIDRIFSQKKIPASSPVLHAPFLIRSPVPQKQTIQDLGNVCLLPGVEDYHVRYCLELSQNLPPISLEDLLPATPEAFIHLKAKLVTAGILSNAVKQLLDRVVICWYCEVPPSSATICESLQDPVMETTV